MILKIHGAVDRADAEADSYVITEDHYIDYLARENVARLIPAYLMARMRTSHFLFLGYGMRDWNLRVILRSIWAGADAALHLVGDPARAERDRPQVLGAARGRDPRRCRSRTGSTRCAPSSGERTGATASEARRARRSPYQGLVPYGEADAEWFFGRDEWREIVVDNLRAYRVSVLYGESGVGKSSFCSAGVFRGLRDAADANLAATGDPQLVGRPFAAWSATNPLAALKEAIRDAVERARAGARTTAADGLARRRARRVGRAGRRAAASSCSTSSRSTSSTTAATRPGARSTRS